MPLFQRLSNWNHSYEDVIEIPQALCAPQGCFPIVLRPITKRDEYAWNEVRTRNAQWLEPWESNDPMYHEGISFNAWVDRLRKEEREGKGVTFVVTYGDCIIGQISLGAVFRGSMHSGIVGYWIDQEYAGHGIIPLAVAMLADWALLDPHGMQLHRLEIDIVPSNERSRRVVQKLGALYEGVRRQYMYIHGQWRDHETYSLLASDAPDGFVQRLMSDTPSM